MGLRIGELMLSIGRHCDEEKIIWGRFEASLLRGVVNKAQPAVAHHDLKM